MADDKINHPKHYSGENGIECIDAVEIMADGIDGIKAVCVGNIVKYIWRCNRKNGIEDIQKAKWYLDKLIYEAGRSQIGDTQKNE